MAVPRFAAVALIAALTLAPLVGVVGAAPTATPNGTAAPTPTPAPTDSPTPQPTPTPTPAASSGGVDAGPYDLTDLRRGGTQPADAPSSVRYLDDTGAVAIRYTPAAPLSNDRQYLQPSTTLHTDKIELYSTRFGSGISSEEFTLHVVFWQEATRTIETENGTKTILVAANQTEKTYQTTLGTGYSTTNVTFPNHFDQKWQTTMWLSQDGDAIDGARWTLAHRSDPGGQNVDISTETDAWTFTAKNAVIPGGIGLVIGLLLNRGTLRKTGRGPDVGGVIWALGAVVLLFTIASAAYFQAAVILDHAPWVMGGLFVVIAYAGGFLFANPVRKIQFERQEIFDAKILPGFNKAGGEPESGDALTDGGTAAIDTDTDFIAADEYKEEVYRDLPEKRAVRTDNGFVVPVRGIRPFLARLFASPARLDLSSFRTRILVDEGRIDEVITVDPETDETVTHIPARLRRALPWDELPRDEETGEILGDWQDKAIAMVGTGAIVLAPGTIGWHVFDSSLGIPAVGALCGLIVTAILGYTAEDGHIEFDEAAIHQNPARTSITHMQASIKDAKDLEAAEEDAWAERAKSKREGRESIERERRTVTDRLIGTMIGDEDGAAVDKERKRATNGHDLDEDHPGNTGGDEEVDDGDE